MNKTLLIVLASSVILIGGGGTSYYFLSNRKEEGNISQKKEEETSKIILKAEDKDDEKEDSELKKENNKPEENKDDYQSEEEKLRRLNDIFLIVEFSTIFFAYFVMIGLYVCAEEKPQLKSSEKLNLTTALVTANVISTLILELIVFPFILMFFKDGKSFLKNLKNKFRPSYFFILIGWFFLIFVFIYLFFLFFEKVFGKK